MEMILWRHADAEYGYPDLQRPLSEKGRKQARRMADFLLPRLPRSTRILVSPALRAQQTADALGRYYQTEPMIAPEARVAEMLRAAAWPEAGGCVLLVGHQPMLGQLAADLLAPGGLGMSLKKGAILWIVGRFRDQAWQARLHLATTAEALTHQGND